MSKRWHGRLILGKTYLRHCTRSRIEIVDQALKFSPLLRGKFEWNLRMRYIQKRPRSFDSNKNLIETLH